MEFRTLIGSQLSQHFIIADMADAQKFEIRRKKNGISVIQATDRRTMALKTKELKMLLVGEQNIWNGVRVVFPSVIPPWI